MICQDLHPCDAATRQYAMEAGNAERRDDGCVASAPRPLGLETFPARVWM
jgi:hypothetical protein